jgi:hypothetical protein
MTTLLQGGRLTHRLKSWPGSVGRAEAHEAVSLPRSPGGQYARDNSRVVHAAVEDRLDKIVKRGPHDIHMRLLAFEREVVRAVDRLQVAGELDAQ